MLLAGGQGNRLYVLTQSTAKPAMPFGGKYRIIDFTLSNCVNSSISTVGVLTQYRPLELNTYIGNGQPWDLDRNDGGVAILPPYTAGKTGQWYKGTANAIYQNLNFLELHDPEYVLILSGDHIYKMDYAKMLQYHKDHNADLTIAVRDVPLEEASRFGIMNTNEDLSIYEFEEKPENPKSTNASMGVYIFTWNKLKHYLEIDEANPESSNDFGGDIIPMMLANNEKLMAYMFNEYWKDVGTISSYWEANMELLEGEQKKFDISDPLWRFYSRHEAFRPQYIGSNTSIKNSMIAEGSTIYGNSDHSMIFSDVTIEDGALVKDSVIMSNTKIGRGATVNYAVIADDVVIEPGAVVGAERSQANEGQIAVIGRGARIKSGQTVKPGEMIDPL